MMTSKGFKIGYLIILALVLANCSSAGKGARGTFSSIEEDPAGFTTTPSTNTAGTSTTGPHDVAQEEVEAQAKAEAELNAPAEPTAPRAAAAPNSLLDPPPGESAVAAPSAPELQKRVSELEAKVHSLNQELSTIRTQKKEFQAISPVESHPADSADNVPDMDPSKHLYADEAMEKYRTGRILLDGGKIAEATLTLTQFANEYPDHPLAGSAQFLIGECYYQQKEFKLAATEYQRVVQVYPRSSAITDALQRLTEVSPRTGASVEAAKYKQRLLSLFPQSPAASIYMTQASVARELQSETPTEEPTERTISTEDPVTIHMQEPPQVSVNKIDETPPPTATIPETAE